MQSPAAEAILDAFIDWSQKISWDCVPDVTRAQIKREMLDYLGCAIAGRAVGGIPAWLQVLIDMGGREDAHVIGGPAVPPHVAALCNGYFGHVLEFDDTHDAATLHAGSAPIPAALAAAERAGNIGGKQLCEAVLLGIELTCRLGVATRLNLSEGGWIYGALLGHFGATLAAAHILDNRPKALRNALGIAYCLISGNRQSTREGAAAKHVQPGFAASNGVLATVMGSAGLDGVKAPLTGEDGLARVYLRGLFNPESALAQLKTRFETDRLSFKPYPTCRFTHPGISAALRMRNELGDNIHQLERMEIIVGPQAHNTVGRPEPERLSPTTRIRAQFSIQWAVAVAMVHGQVTPAELVNEIPPSPRVKAWIARLACDVDATAAERDIGGCILRAYGPFGVHEIQEKHAKGHPDNPLSDDELLKKFKANVSLAGIDGDDAFKLASEILDIDSVEDVSVLLARLLVGWAERSDAQRS